MSPERWNQIQAAYEAALGLTPEERIAFLGQNCAADPELRTEVERLFSEKETPNQMTGETRRVSYSPGDPSLNVDELVSGRYKILRALGRGGMGEVYLAHDELLDEQVAIKTLRSGLALDAMTRRRFQQEIQLARKITHPNVCRIFEVGVHQATERWRPPLPFFSMEFLTGETLRTRIHRKPMSAAEAFPIAVQMAEGLQAAHSLGIVHTDFKSSNVILVSSPGGGVRAVLTDFGLARLDPTRAISGDDPTMVVLPREIAGTVSYMSPEHMTGGTITASSDIYSFGIVLFEMASGELPFAEDNMIYAAMERASNDDRALRTLVPHLHPRWTSAISRCLQKDPARRFTSATELARWFRGGVWRSPSIWTRREWIRSAAVVGVPAVAGGSAWYWGSRPFEPKPKAAEWYTKGVDALHSMTYEAARKAFEQAITADPKFALAHASLARALYEMDYSDQSKDVMLRAIAIAQESRLSKTDERRVRALQFIVSRDFERAAPLIQQLEDEAEPQHKAAAALESGWLAQQREDTEAAAAAYERAVKLNPAYPAASVRQGFIYARRGQDAKALKAFEDAERLYTASSNHEGVTEALLQRARLLNRRSRSGDAMPVIERGLASARTVGNRYHEILLILQQGVAARNLGDVQRATELTRAAIDSAISEHMDNIALGAIIDLGSISMVKGDLKTAEPLFQRALGLAQRGKIPRYEALASLSLGSLHEQALRLEEARRCVDGAVTFYQKGGYKRELMQAMVILGGVYERLGEYEQGARASRDALAQLKAFKDSTNEALFRQRLGRNLRGAGAWPEALDQYTQASALLGTGIRSANARLNCAQLCWQLGRAEEAAQFLRQVQGMMGKESNAKARTELDLKLAEIAYDEGRVAEADRLCRQGLAAQDRGGDADRDLTLVRNLVQIRSRNSSETSISQYVNRLDEAKLAGNAACARLAFAEAWIAVGETAKARQFLSEAIRFFEPRKIFESLWRAHALELRLSPNSGGSPNYRNMANEALANLRNAWNSTAVDLYLQKVNIKPIFELLRG